MLPVVVLVGRPNVGKSTLFNQLTRSRAALVADQPGLTRDRQYGIGKVGSREYVVVDTGGLSGDRAGIAGLLAQQARVAIDEADHILFLLDARDGLAPEDLGIAELLRPLGKPVTPVVNKIDGVNPDVATADFHALGLGEPVAISAAHGRGVHSLIDGVLERFPATEGEAPESLADGLLVAVVGRPNVGKSTLVNRLLGAERVLAFDQPGTTRDSIFIPFEREGRAFTLIDTAGVRRRGRVHEAIEKFSVIKTLQAIESANVVFLVVDAQQGIGEQDATLAGHILESGRALVVVINKWDGIPHERREQVRSDIARKLPFLEFAPRRFVSALHGSGVGHLLAAAVEVYESAARKLSTPELTRILMEAVAEHAPPAVDGRRIKLRYAHQGGQNPPIIVIHGNQTGDLPQAYKRYLTNRFRQVLDLRGTPVRLEFRTGQNPFEGRRNVLTERQRRKRKRLLEHVKRGR